jgi:hypothetical protein
MQGNKQILHRLISSTATFQKGLYHLFISKSTKALDAFDDVLRKYQSIYLLGVTLTLLDFDGVTIDSKRNHFAKNDPAGGVNHTQVLNWKGFNIGHPLYNISIKYLNICKRIVEARHNMIYRPFYCNLNEEWSWEDCTLKGLLRNIPSTQEIENVYKDFFKAITYWENNAKGEEIKYIPFFTLLTFQKFSNSGKTLLIAYTNLLNPDDMIIEEHIREYVIKLFGKGLKL